MLRRTFTKSTILFPGTVAAMTTKQERIKIAIKLIGPELLSMDFKNGGPESLRLWSDSISWFWESLRLYVVTQDKSKNWRCWAQKRFNVNYPRTVELAPGDSRSWVIPINEDWPSIAILRDPTEKVGFRVKMSAVWKDNSKEGLEHHVLRGPIESNQLDAMIAFNGIY